MHPETQSNRGSGGSKQRHTRVTNVIGSHAIHEGEILGSISRGQHTRQIIKKAMRMCQVFCYCCHDKDHVLCMSISSEMYLICAADIRTYRDGGIQPEILQLWTQLITVHT